MTIDVEGAQGTGCDTNDATGAIIGIYIDVNSAYHGFLRTR